MKISVKHLRAAAVLTFMFILVLSVQSISKTNTHKTAGLHALPVDVYRVEKPKDLPVDLEYPARLKSVQRVTVYARVSGVLMKKFYKDGQFVKKGDLLYEIEPDTYKALVDSAKAEVKSAKAALNKAKRDWRRVKALYDAKTVSQKTRDAALSAYEIAKADLEKAKANLTNAKINFNYTSVRAASDGVVGLPFVDVGNFVKSGTALTVITKLNPIYADFSIPDIGVVKQKYYIKNSKWKQFGDNLKAVLKINNAKYPKEGVVEFIDSNIDEKTSTVKARAVFDNMDNYLMPGEFERIILKGLFVKNTILVPQKAVLQNPLGVVVFVVDKKKAQIRPIKLGETSGKYYIVNWGLKRGDMVIVNNFFRLRPGMPVKIDKIVNVDLKDK